MKVHERIIQKLCNVQDIGEKCYFLYLHACLREYISNYRETSFKSLIFFTK